MKRKFRYDPKKDGVTPSLLLRWLGCPVAGRLTCFGLGSTRDSMSAKWGTLAHNVLEHVHLQDKPTTKAVNKQITRTLAEYESENGALWDDVDLRFYEQIGAELHAVLPRYFDYWAHKGVKFKKTEVVLDQAWRGFRLRGMVDGLLGFKKDDYVLETKTRGMIVEHQLLSTLPKDFQSNYYLHALSVPRKKRVKGFWYNIIRRPGTRPKKGETLVDYRARLEETIDKDPEHWYKRYEVAVSDDDYAEWQEYLYEVLCRFDEWYRSGMPGETYGKPCISGKFPCSYLDWCHNGRTELYRVRDRMFKELPSAKA